MNVDTLSGESIKAVAVRVQANARARGVVLTDLEAWFAATELLRALDPIALCAYVEDAAPETIEMDLSPAAERDG